MRYTHLTITATVAVVEVQAVAVQAAVELAVVLIAH
jgi:hypothetical protein